MSDSDGLICAYVLDGGGAGRPVDWAGIKDWRETDGPLWVHLDRKGADSMAWLTADGGLPEGISRALLTEETRPNCEVLDDGLLLILRGVNLNPGADPEDMVALRIWVERTRVITVRHRKLSAVDDLRQAMERGHGPHSIPQLVVTLAAKLIERMGPTISALEDEVDGLETKVLTAASRPVRHHLHSLRHQAVDLRRYIAPQREAMARLMLDDAGWFDRADRLRLRDIADNITRYVEALDAARERAALIQEELTSRLSEEMNKTMYFLSIVATIFLPLGFLTGLLGVNVAGMPGTANALAFPLVCVLLVGIGVLEYWLFKRLKWL